MSTMKRFLVISALSLAALALAVNGSVGSEGRGTARSQDGRIGRFEYRVVKTTVGEHTNLEGRLRFEQVANAAGRPALIEMGTPRIVNVEENICRFAGHGSLTVPDGHGGHRTLRGTVHGVAVDIRTHAHPEGHDRFEINFAAAERGVTFSFAGQVGDGDLVVFKRS
jgi:hypothetical protein